MSEFSINYVINNLLRGNLPSGTGGRPLFGRVIDIILDENHPGYDAKGGAKAINGVYYRLQNTEASEDTSTRLDFAYQGAGQIKTVPVVGEIVQLTSQPTSKKTSLVDKFTTYYTRTVNVWNNPNSNTYLDVYSNSTLDVSSNGDFDESATINPIKSALGDVQIEGRQGQSIRFTGAKGDANPWVDNSNKSKPIILISNGQIETEEGFTTITEDINEDEASLYFVADHQVPLNQASNRRESYNNPPTQADQFKGNQVLLNAGRLFFNAKEKDILLSSVESIGLNTRGSINLDAEEYICLDSPQIFLGERARTAEGDTKEPVLLGNQTEILLDTLFNMLSAMASDMAGASTIKGDAIPLLNKRGKTMLPLIKVLQNQINPSGPSQLKSRKVFTE
tara:strand:+ start:4497 stop:5675 length:1179 start_codon:yes stop_codon:yes gene_type:complete